MTSFWYRMPTGPISLKSVAYYVNRENFKTIPEFFLIGSVCDNAIRVCAVGSVSLDMEDVAVSFWSGNSSFGNFRFFARFGPFPEPLVSGGARSFPVRF